MRRLTGLCFLVVCAIFLVKHAECTVSIRSLSPATIGSTVVIYCDIYNELGLPSGIYWSKQSYNGSNSITYSTTTSTNLAKNYAFTYTQMNSTYYVSTFTITGVTSDDYATFICMNKASVNLTQDTSVDPLTLCKNGSYNQVVFAFLFATNVVLVALMIFVLRCLMQMTTVNILVAFGCILGAILFSILMLIFWISPIFAAPNSTNSSYIYWSPIVIVPACVIATFILWGGLLFYIVKSFLANKKDKKNLISMIVFIGIALAQLLLILVIIFSIVYCTGQSSLPSSTDYSAASVTCAILTFVAIIILCAYVFWMFKDSFKSIGILNKAETKVKFPDIPKLLFDRYSARDQPSKKLESKTKVEVISDRPETGRSTASALNTTNTDDEGGKKGKKGKKGKEEADASGAESAAEGGKKGKKGKKGKEDAGASETEGAGEKKKKGKKGKKGGD